MRHHVARQCISAPRCYAKCKGPPIHSGVVGCAPATLEKRVPINQYSGLGLHSESGLKLRRVGPLCHVAEKNGNTSDEV